MVLWQRTEWIKFKNWAEKFGWIQIYFMLRENKTAQASFIMPSGKVAVVEIADDTDNCMVVMDIVIK